MSDLGGTVLEIISHPQAQGATDACLLKDFVDKTVGPDSIEGFPNVKGQEKVVMVAIPGVVSFLNDCSHLFFRRSSRAEPALIGREKIVSFKVELDAASNESFEDFGHGGEE
jgi:hypothetical protein